MKHASSRYFLPIALAGALVSAGCTQALSLSLTTGECVLLPDDNDVASVTTTHCTQDHHAEVVGSIILPDPTLPERADLDSRAEDGCRPHFEEYVGTTVTTSTMELMWLLPTEASWKTGDRTITCLAVAPDGQVITQSLKSSGL